jgi:hypothetical protein
MSKYQVTYKADGEIERVIELPEEPEKKRTLIVRAESVRDAKRKAELLYSLAT